MFFIDEESKNFYKEKIGQISKLDVYKRTIIYLLSNNKDTRNNFKDVYDINDNEINLNCFKAPWQTNTSLNLCRLAFNLFGDIASDDIDFDISYTYTVSSIFKNIDLNLGIEAIKIRFLTKNVDL